MELVDHRAEALPPSVDRVVLPGGFSHGDALRAGALAARSPIMTAVAAHARAGGFVLGICNGFQILCEAGLLPGALLVNASGRFVARDVRVVIEPKSPLAAYFERPLRLPIAHGAGRYVPGTTSESADRAPAFRYDRADDSNPGWTGIAGVLGRPRANVLGLMPHPERTEADGRLFFEAILRYDRERP